MKVGDFVRRRYGLKYRYGVILYDLFNDNERNKGKAFRVQWTCGKRAPCLANQLELIEADN